jgi:hypothetical protein
LFWGTGQIAIGLISATNEILAKKIHPQKVAYSIQDFSSGHLLSYRRGFVLRKVAPIFDGGSNVGNLV